MFHSILCAQALTPLLTLFPAYDRVGCREAEAAGLSRAEELAQKEARASKAAGDAESAAHSEAIRAAAAEKVIQRE